MTNEILDEFKKGSVLIISTDIGFEVACDASSNEAVSKLTSVVEKLDVENFSVLVNSLDQLARYIAEFPEVAADIIELSASPLNLILPMVSGISKQLVINGHTPFRVVKSGLVSNLSKRTNRPILAVPVLAQNKTVVTQPKDIPAAYSSITLGLPAQNDSLGSGQLPAVIALEINGEIKIIRS